MTSWTPRPGDRLRFVGSGPLPKGTVGTVTGEPTKPGGRWRVDHSAKGIGSAWGNWTTKQLRTLWEPIRTEPVQPRPFSTGLPRKFDPASFSVHIDGEPTDIKLEDVSWQTAADKELSAAATAAGLDRLDGETDEMLRARIRAKLGHVYTAEGMVELGGRVRVNDQTGEVEVSENGGTWSPVGQGVGGSLSIRGGSMGSGVGSVTDRVPEVIQLRVEFRDGSGQILRQSDVRCIVQTPNGAVFPYGVPPVREESPGRYVLQFTAQVPGTYRVRWEGDEAVAEELFEVTGKGGASDRLALAEVPVPHWDEESRRRILDELEVDAKDALADIDAALDGLDEEDG